MYPPFPLPRMTESTPLVFVQGFLSTADLFSWEHHINNSIDVSERKIIIPSLGPVSSLYDRACELFYSLVGGTVDYGDSHSSTHRHSRYGRFFSKGLYPAWSKKRPLHFLGHSVGGPTIIKLQHLLEQGLFGTDCHPDMILSVNAVCAPFRGTQLVYSLGESLTAAPQIRPFSLGAFLGKLVHIIAYLSPLLPSVLDVHADARSLSFHETSVVSFLRHLCRSQWAESKDAAPYDMTFEAADIRDNLLEGHVHPNTFYRSHVSVMTRQADSIKQYEHRPQITFSLSNILLYASSTLIGTFDHRFLQPPPSFLPENDQQDIIPEEPDPTIVEVIGEEHLANDGIVPIFSQWHPSPCRMTVCSHNTALDVDSFEKISNLSDGPPVAGQWMVMTVNNTNHLDLMPGLGKSKYQKAFWIELDKWLHKVDTVR